MSRRRDSLNKRNRRASEYKKQHKNIERQEQNNNIQEKEDIFNVLDHFAEEDYSKRELIMDEDTFIYENTSPIKKTDSYSVTEDVTDNNYHEVANLDDTKINILNLEKTNTFKKIKDKTNNEEDISNERIMIDIGSKKHISFKTRITVLSILLICSLGIASLFLYGFVTFKDKEAVLYNHSGNSDYRLYLKDNEDNITYLDRKDIKNSNKVYLMDLVNKIDVNFNYNINLNQQVDIDFKYDIVAEIIINDLDGKELYSDKFTLLSPKDIKMRNDNEVNITEEVKNIDIGYYQSIANSYSSQLEEETDNYLNIYLEVNRKDVSNKLLLDDVDEVNILIPLSDNVTMSNIVNDDLVDNDNQEIKRIGFINTKRDIICIALVFVILAVYFILRLYNLLILLKDKTSVYDKYIKKILRKYDSYIAESTTVVNLKKMNVIKIKNFDELLDVYNSLGLPIIYCEVVKGQKSYFYIKNNKDIYLLQVKAVDLEKK